MNRDEVAEVLAVVRSFDHRTVGTADILVWHEMLERYDKDTCIDAVVRHKSERPDVWLEPGHVLQIVRAMRNEMIERADPDDRPHMVGLNGMPRDRYGFVDKSDPNDDDFEYPAGWTAEQRTKHYWQQIQNRRDVVGMREDPTAASTPHMPAREDVRAACMAHIRGTLAK